MEACERMLSLFKRGYQKVGKYGVEDVRGLRSRVRKAGFENRHEDVIAIDRMAKSGPVYYKQLIIQHLLDSVYAEVKSSALDAYVSAALGLRKEEKARLTSISKSGAVTGQSIRCNILIFNRPFAEVVSE